MQGRTSARVSSSKDFVEWREVGVGEQRGSALGSTEYRLFYRRGTTAWVHPPRAPPSPGDAGGTAAYKCMELQEGVRNPWPAIQREIQEPHFHLITCTSTRLSLELQSHRKKSLHMQKPSRTEGLTKYLPNKFPDSNRMRACLCPPREPDLSFYPTPTSDHPFQLRKP